MTEIPSVSGDIFSNEDAARAHIEATRWPNGPYCPYCGVTGDGVKALKGESMAPGWYHCRACRKKFTVRVGTVYERSHIQLHKWLQGFRLYASSKKGFSAHQLHRTLGITYRSAWFMAHRIREAMRELDPSPPGGKDKVVEADETFIGKPGDVFVNGRGWVQMRGTTTKAQGDRACRARWSCPLIPCRKSGCTNYPQDAWLERRTRQPPAYG